VLAFAAGPVADVAPAAAGGAEVEGDVEGAGEGAAGVAGSLGCLAVVCGWPLSAGVTRTVDWGCADWPCAIDVDAVKTNMTTRAILSMRFSQERGTNNGARDDALPSTSLTASY